jgi:hypothetical protein
MMLNNQKVFFGHAVAPARRCGGRAASISPVGSEDPSKHFFDYFGDIYV